VTDSSRRRRFQEKIDAIHQHIGRDDAIRTFGQPQYRRIVARTQQELWVPRQMLAEPWDETRFHETICVEIASRLPSAECAQSIADRSLSFAQRSGVKRGYCRSREVADTARCP
jgi:hypothetical protein